MLSQQKDLSLTGIIALMQLFRKSIDASLGDFVLMKAVFLQNYIDIGRQSAALRLRFLKTPGHINS